METIRNQILTRGNIWVSNFSIRPGKLFSGAEQRLSIYISQRSKTNSIYSTKYLKWNTDERDILFDSKIAYNKIIHKSYGTVWLKLASKLNQGIFEKVFNCSDRVGNFIRGGKFLVYYKNTGIGYYVTTTLVAPECVINGVNTSSSRETTLSFESEMLSNVFHCLLSSSLYFLFYQAISNCRDLNPTDLAGFKFPNSILKDEKLIKLSKELQNDLNKNSWFQTRQQKQTGEVKIQSFSSYLSKPIIDEIDKVLASHYGFSEEELDFIINYDIKYRMGSTEEEE